ncbi:hypothetical protein C1645_749309 [Glomus cerebriforme]|uniref:Uncharacterized protein n=1 Tax=Glomus cerebriforme TaxID=658196 RepID=A0A397TPY9_9GLOM|nr:hypothetical protein C1645_749309 [Glomus cerebriforme]
MEREMVRIQTILILTIPNVISVPVPQNEQTGQTEAVSYGSINLNDSETKNRLLYWVFGIVGIVVFVEIIYWMLRCVNLLKKGRGKNNNNQNNNVGVNGVVRRRGLFDTPSYAGSVDEQLPPYEGFSLPKYNSIIIENNSDEGTITIHDNMEVNTTSISDDNTTNLNNLINSNNSNSTSDSNLQSTVELSSNPPSSPNSTRSSQSQPSQPSQSSQPERLSLSDLSSKLN